MKEKLLSVGSVLSAGLASICCIGPLVFVALGVTSATWAAGLTWYRPIFIGITLVFLGVGFYFTYRKRGSECAPGSFCSTRRGHRWNRIVLWIAAALSLGLILFPYLPQ